MFELAENRESSRGVHCGEDGLYLGPWVPLIVRGNNGYNLRPDAEIEALLVAAYETPPDFERCIAGLRNVAAHLEEGRLPVAMIAAVQLQLSEIPEDRIKRLAEAEELLKAIFNPDQPRDEQGRWTGEGDHDVIIPASARPRSRCNPRAWEDFPNPDFRNRLAAAEQSAGRPHFGYREVHDSRDLPGQRNLALGRYQMTPAALQAIEMMDRKGNWTGKHRIRSQAEFLADPEGQERALSDYMRDNERQLRANGAFDHIGATVDGLRDRFPVKRAGLLAAAHRYGARETRDYLNRIAGNGYTSKGLDLNRGELAIETRLRTFSEASYE